MCHDTLYPTNTCTVKAAANWHYEGNVITLMHIFIQSWFNKLLWRWDQVQWTLSRCEVVQRAPLCENIYTNFLITNRILSCLWGCTRVSLCLSDTDVCGPSELCTEKCVCQTRIKHLPVAAKQSYICIIQSKSIISAGILILLWVCICTVRKNEL